MKTIQDVKIGDKVENMRNGKGIVSGKTQRINWLDEQIKSI